LHTRVNPKAKLFIKVQSLAMNLYATLIALLSLVSASAIGNATLAGPSPNATSLTTKAKNGSSSPQPKTVTNETKKEPEKKEKPGNATDWEKKVPGGNKTEKAWKPANVGSATARPKDINNSTPIYHGKSVKGQKVNITSMSKVNQTKTKTTSTDSTKPTQKPKSEKAPENATKGEDKTKKENTIKGADAKNKTEDNKEWTKSVVVAYNASIKDEEKKGPSVASKATKEDKPDKAENSEPKKGGDAPKKEAGAPAGEKPYTAFSYTSKEVDLTAVDVSDAPSDLGSDVPSDMPSDMPSLSASDVPSDMPSDAPSVVSLAASDSPSMLPTAAASAVGGETRNRLRRGVRV
jgi:hypothetical protein